MYLLRLKYKISILQAVFFQCFGVKLPGFVVQTIEVISLIIFPAVLGFIVNRYSFLLYNNVRKYYLLFTIQVQLFIIYRVTHGQTEKQTFCILSETLFLSIHGSLLMLDVTATKMIKYDIFLFPPAAYFIFPGSAENIFYIIYTALFLNSFIQNNTRENYSSSETLSRL